jgi:hypothetical protein
MDASGEARNDFSTGCAPTPLRNFKFLRRPPPLNHIGNGLRD